MPSDRVMLPTTLESTLADLERRLQIMERTSRNALSSIRDGALTIQDAAGNPVVVIGKQADGTYGVRSLDASGRTLVSLGQVPGGAHGIQVANVNGRVLFQVTSENGQAAPYAFVPAITGVNDVISGGASGFRPGTTNAAFTELWRADFYSVGPNVNYDFSFWAAASSMDWRILAFEETTGTPTVVASGTETTNVARQGTFSLPAACLIAGTGTDPVGRFMTLRLEAKKNSGASTVDVSQNAPYFNHA
jgi:hypothetical protein